MARPTQHSNVLLFPVKKERESPISIRLILLMGALFCGTFSAIFFWDTGIPIAAKPTPLQTGLDSTVSANFRACGGAPRVTCMVDGDTFWLDGQKVRVADINTPEVSRPGCPFEKALGDQATDRMAQLLNEGPFELARKGRDEDRYGRKLRIVMRGGQSLGDTLIDEGLAEPWTGRRKNWC